ncbi:TetR/AcrR family transcriptional regulator [Patulibacter brassicae]|uniref:TetR/AcrR family transcriptional regulator n=1 Tax=Patulibacter brassicae TaxID=1705717 RepID=A0ABU4VPH3_9ACTN|nr:TetR/AcrR family transcriptional regulator [Patulibacter brassicae]MDX8152944.1 TetR/AcrR family transcriptional regulator [Patulibacter brassicae]
MAPSTRMSAEERREQVIAVASRLMAERGIGATPTAEVAEEAGISHAYLFRLFPTKQALVTAVVERCNAEIHEAFKTAADRARATGEDVLPAIGMAYGGLLSDPRRLLLQLHAHALSPRDPDVRAAMQASFRRLFALIQRETDATPDEIRRFFAQGMLMNVLAATGIATLDEPFADVLRTGELDGASCFPDDFTASPLDPVAEEAPTP